MKMKENEYIGTKKLLLYILIAVGVIARFFVMTIGNNYDFESYQIVGGVASTGSIVYALTSRYNYGFIFFVILGFFYKFASCFSESILIYRILIVSLLTFADAGIALWIAKKNSVRNAIIFFLNPLSIIITGYHNQFDNIAVLFALLSVNYYEDSDEITKKDFFSIAFLTVSLITKHILYIFFIWILFHHSHNKKIVYACIPPLIFLISFIPFALNSQEAFDGIINNVFLYRGYNNYPLFSELFSRLAVPSEYYFMFFVVIMILMGFLLRKKSYECLLLLYFVSLVGFSSAIANQYLIIPMVALSISDKKIFYWVYVFIGTVYFVLNDKEFCMVDQFVERFPFLKTFFETLATEGGVLVTVMALILVVFLLFQIIRATDDWCN